MSSATAKAVLGWLERVGTKSARGAMSRYGIHAKYAYGVPMSALLHKSKEIGLDQSLSLELWDTGCYEARLLATMIGDPKRVTRAQMNAWARGFENWADGDTACFKLFDRSPLAWELVRPWAKADALREFAKVKERAQESEAREEGPGQGEVVSRPCPKKLKGPRRGG